MLNQGLSSSSGSWREEWYLCGECWRVPPASFLAVTCLPPQQHHGAGLLGWLTYGPGRFTVYRFTGLREKLNYKLELWFGFNM